MKLNIVYQFNERYAPYAGVSIESVCQNNTQFDKIAFYILGEKLAEESIAKLRKCVLKYQRDIYFVSSENIVKKMVEWKLPKYRNSYAANLRMFLAELLPEAIDYILYLDADTIVTGSLEQLATLDMGEYALAMVQDSLGEKHKKLLGFSPKDAYYNSGVILFHMGNWRKYGLSEQIVNHIQTVRAQYASPDQDLLNVVCKKYIMQMELKYNLQPIHKAFLVKNYKKVYRDAAYYTEKEIYEAIENPVIHHMFRFIGEFPWNARNLHPDNEMFTEYLLKSEWREYIKEPADVGVSIRFERILYKILPEIIFLKIFKLAHDRFIAQADALSKKNKIDQRM